MPQDAGLKKELQKHARNFLRIFNNYNLPYLAKPGDDLFAAARYDSMVQARKELYARLAAGEEKDTILKDLESRDQVYHQIYTDSLLPFSPP